MIAFNRDGDNKDKHDLCVYPVKTNVQEKIWTDQPPQDVYIAKCMDMIKPKDVIRGIESYYTGGILKYENHTEEQKQVLEKILTT